MATATSKPRATKHRALTIRGNIYHVEQLPTAPDGERAVRLSRPGLDVVYTVSAARDGSYACECGDWTFRGSETGRPCKHLVAAKEAGLLPLRFARQEKEQAPTTFVAAERSRLADRATWSPAADAWVPAAEAWLTSAERLEVIRAEGRAIKSDIEGGLGVDVAMADGDAAGTARDAEIRGAGGLAISTPEPTPGRPGGPRLAEDTSNAQVLAGRFPHPGRDEEDDHERLSLAKVVAIQAAAFRAWRTPTGDLLADHVAELARSIQALDAATPRRDRQLTAGR